MAIGVLVIPCLPESGDTIGERLAIDVRTHDRKTMNATARLASRRLSTIAASGLTLAALILTPLQASLASASAVDSHSVSSEIPRGFGLDEGLEDYGSDGGRIGPSKRIRGLELDPCNAISWKPRGWSQRMVVRNNGPETQQIRELLTFTKPERAARAVAAIRTDLEDCPGDTVDPVGYASRVKVYDVTTGYDDVLWSVTARRAIATGRLGGYFAQVVRVGKAVVLNYDYGEFGGPSRAAAEALNSNSQEFAPMMCRWTQAGC